MSQEQKAARKARKSALTREINAVERFIAENDFDEVKRRAGKIKLKFTEFERVHDEYHDSLDDETEIDDSEQYFYDTQNNYVASLKSIKAYIAERKAEETAIKAEAEQKQAVSRNELLELVNLPKLELDAYDGDPLKYHSFLAVFDEHVDRVTHDPGVKLSRLLQYTTGRAKEAIRYCSIVGGEKGYDEARAILARRFGDQHIVTDMFIKSLKTGKQARTPEDLQRLADDLTICHSTLSKLKKLSKIDTQSFIRDVGNRLIPYVWNRWRRHALEQKRETDRYPDFTDFVKFVVQ